MTNLELQKMANEVRKGIITGVHAAKAGHPGGSLSAADIFTETASYYPRDIQHRVYMQHWLTVVISR